MTAVSSCNEGIKTGLEWSQLSPIPDEVGFAGAYAGISNDHLIVAGGSNFPSGTRPWSGGVKFWNDKIYALKKGENSWKEAGRLPRAMGYGVSLSWNDGILLIGGAGQYVHYSNVYFIKYTDGSVVIDTLPSLPEPLANSCGAIINNVVYIAGGLSSPSAKLTQKIFWALDLNKPEKEREWHILEPWPGESRMLSVAGAAGNEFYLVSGTTLKVNAGDTVAHRQYLADAYAFNVSGQWRKINDLPHPVVAAPSPAFTKADGSLLVFGGDDGSRAEMNNVLKDKHPGFRTEILHYIPLSDEWTVAGNVFTDRQPNAENDPNASTWAPVTTPLVIWGNDIVIPGGEARPGVRTNRVLMAKPF